MKLPQTVTTFYIDSARYQISNRSGSQATLVINYAQNSHHLEGLTDSSDSADLKTAATSVARDLLSRKHGVNFAGPK